MASIRFSIALAAAAALAGAAALAHQAPSAARQQHAQHHHAQHAGPALHVVANDSAPGEASYGWQYFSDPRALRAVVISPSGEYFLSRGDGPRQITGPAGQRLAKQPG